jgi:phage virion morphogenesis protein
MSSVSVRLEGDTEELLAKLKKMEGIDKAGIMNAIAEGLRTSTMERFENEESPDGTKWKPSIRASGDLTGWDREKKTVIRGGKTLTLTGALKTSIHAQADATGATVGTDLIYAATHQFGDERTIRAKNSKYLRFQIGGKWVSVPSVRVKIPARPFLGISQEDEDEIRAILEEVLGE